MNEELDAELVAKGARQYKQVLGVAVLITLAVLIGEMVEWHALGFVITQAVLLALLSFFGLYVAKYGRMRWGLFMIMLACGAHDFLLGGIHLTDPKEAAVDPLCYWLAGAGLLVVGLGCFVLYSLEIDTYFKELRSRAR